jgi:hypothetical protein
MTPYNKAPDSKRFSIVQKLLEGKMRKTVAYEEGVSESFVTEVRQDHPLFFWNIPLQGRRKPRTDV